MQSSKWSTWLTNVRNTYNKKELLEKVNATGLIAAQEEGARRTFMNRDSGFGQLGSALVELTWFENGRLPSLAILLGKSPLYEVYEDYLLLNIHPWNYGSEDGYDTQAFRGIFDRLDTMPMYKPLMGLSIIEQFTEPTIRHGVAWVAWKTKDDTTSTRTRSRTRSKAPYYVFAFYDPMNYYKPDRNAKYNYADRVFTANYEQMVEEHGNDRDIRFWDLAEYCHHKTSKEYHCPQYVMNAEYCHLYSLMFLYLWVEHGLPKSKRGMSTTVRSTYLVKPHHLTRADTRESMLFRVITMAFTVAVLDTYMSRLVRRKDIKTNEALYTTLTNVRAMLKAFKGVWVKMVGAPLVPSTAA